MFCLKAASMLEFFDLYFLVYFIFQIFVTIHVGIG